MRDLIIVGAGGFGRETADVVAEINGQSPTWRILGVADEAPSSVNLRRLEAGGLHHLGGLERIPPRASVALCVGDPSARSRIALSLSDRDVEFPPLVHPSSTIGTQFSHGGGLIALAGVSLGTNVAVGDHVHLNPHAVIGHDAVLEDFVSVNPNATVSGECHVQSESLLGAASIVLQGLTIGRRVTVGAGACVTRSVPDELTVVGIPAHPLEKGQYA